MAKDFESSKLRASAKQALQQAHQALDAYFELLKNSVSSSPSGGTELGEKLKDQGVENISALQEVVKRLSQAGNFEEAANSNRVHTLSTKSLGLASRKLRRGIYKDSENAGQASP